MRYLTLLIAFCFCYFLGFSNTYFVSFSSGNDANTAAQAQSSATPWKTMDKILANINSGTIAAGSIILLKRGDAWLLPLDFNPNKALTFDAYGPGTIKPYLSGFISVPGNGWTLINSTLGIWETTNAITAPRSNAVNMVTIDGVPYAMGRTPNATATNKGWLNYESNTSTSVTDAQSPFDATYNGAQIVVRVTHSNLERGQISTISGTTINFSTSGWSYGVPGGSWGYFVQNSLKCVDQFGEWFYNTSTKKLDVCVGPLNNPASFNIQYPYLDTAIQPRASNITFHGIRIEGANRYVVYNDYGGLSNIWFRSCDLAYSGGDLLSMQGKIYCGIDSSTGKYANSNGFVYGWHNNGTHITNTIITQIGMFAGMLQKDGQGRYGMGIFVSDHANLTDTGLQAKNLVITHIGYAGVFLGGAHNRVQSCYVDSVCSVLDDGGCVYIGNYTAVGATPATTSDNVFIGNLLLHGLGAPEGTPGNNTSMAQGLYFDDNTNNTIALNNVFAFNSMSGMFMHNTNRCRAENNISYSNAQQQFYMQDDGIGDSIYLDTVRFNRFVTSNSSQLIYYWALDNTSLDSKNFNTWGIFDHNTIGTPFTTNVAKLNHFGGILFATYSLAGWQGTWHYDLNSTGMPVTVSDVRQMYLAYNTSAANSNTYSFPFCTYIDINNVTFFNTITLQPVTGDLLLFPSAYLQ